MTRDQAKKIVPIIQAYADGLNVQYQKGDQWVDYDPFIHNLVTLDVWRIKTEPKLRPWKPEEAIALIGKALLRAKSACAGTGLIVAVSACEEIRFGAWNQDHTWRVQSLQLCLEQFEHSTDGGKTWLPCGVLEESK